MLTKRNLAAIAFFFIPLTSPAQQSFGGLTVQSDPPGAEVILKGELTVSGITPVVFSQGLQGPYRVDVRKSGYETYSTMVYLRRENPASLSVSLSEKTRLKALARSFLIPGWGQKYAEQELKGACLFLLTAGAVGAYLIADHDFDDKNDEYNQTLRLYNQASTYDERQRLYSALAEDRKEAYDAENIRRVTIGATVAAWGLNMLDLFFFFPRESHGLSTGSLSVQPDWKHGKATLLLSYRF
jgi:hypothetical protein